MKLLRISKLFLLMIALMVSPLQAYAMSSDSPSEKGCHDMSVAQDDGVHHCHTDTNCDADQNCAASCAKCSSCSSLSFISLPVMVMATVSTQTPVQLSQKDFIQPPSFVEPRPPRIPA